MKCLDSIVRQPGLHTFSADFPVSTARGTDPWHNSPDRRHPCSYLGFGMYLYPAVCWQSRGGDGNRTATCLGCLASITNCPRQVLSCSTGDIPQPDDKCCKGLHKSGYRLVKLLMVRLRTNRPATFSHFGRFSPLIYLPIFLVGSSEATSGRPIYFASGR